MNIRISRKKIGFLLIAMLCGSLCIVNCEKKPKQHIKLEKSGSKLRPAKPQMQQNTTKKPGMALKKQDSNTADTASAESTPTPGTSADSSKQKKSLMQKPR